MPYDPVQTAIVVGASLLAAGTSAMMLYLVAERLVGAVREWGARKKAKSPAS